MSGSYRQHLTGGDVSRSPVVDAVPATIDNQSYVQYRRYASCILCWQRTTPRYEPHIRPAPAVQGSPAGHLQTVSAIDSYSNR